MKGLGDGVVSKLTEVGLRDELEAQLALVDLLEHQHVAQVKKDGVEFDREGGHCVPDEQSSIQRNRKSSQDL